MLTGKNDVTTATISGQSCRADRFNHSIISDYRSDLKRCSGCRLFQYCGRDCQLADWTSFHKHGECRLFRKLSSVPDFELESLVELHYLPLFLRTHLLLKAKPWLMHQKFQMHDGTERSLADVPDDAEACGLHTNMCIAAYDLSMLADWSNFSAVDVQSLVSLFHKIRKSFLLIERGQIGLGLYVPISGLKHSCRPNTSYVFKGKKVEVRAMRDIAEGEDVTIDLADLMKPKADRQGELALMRGIVCDCDRCREGDQGNEVTLLAENEEYRSFLLSPGRFLSPRFVFDEFMRLMKIKEKYQGRYHPDFVYCMYLAVITAPVMPYKTRKDKQNFDLLVERLKEAIPLSYGLDCEVVNMQILLLVTGLVDWSNLLP